MTRCLFTAINIFCLLVASTASAQSGKRLDVPEVAAIEDSTKAIADVYKKEYEAAKTPQLKQALAKKMLEDARNTTDDAAAKYALLQVARKIASSIGDVDVAMQAVDVVDQAFNVEAGQLRKEAITALAPLAKSPADHYMLARYVRVVNEDLVRDDQFDLALELTDTAIASAKKTGDPDLVKQWVRRQQLLHTQAAAYEKVKEDFEKLRASPADAAANSKAGRFLCFVKGDWPRGLPMLSLSEPGELQALAARDLKGTDKPAEQAALADAWFDLAQTLETHEKAGVLNHAADYYRKAIPSLSAIPKRRAENRLQEITAASAPFVKDEWQELLDFVELGKKNGKWNQEGAWTREGLSLVSNGRGGTYFAIPVAVDGSFELEITLTYAGGHEALNVSLSHPCNNANFQLNSSVGGSGLARVDGRESPNQSSKWRVPRYPLEKGRSYKVKVTVLREKSDVAVAADVNNARHFRWTGPATQLTEPEVTQTPKKLEGRFVLGAWDTPVTIHSVRLKTKTAPARFVE